MTRFTGTFALESSHIPVFVKVAYSAFVAVLVPLYWWRYGPANFLWFSDVALLAMVPALWLESRLLASMMALAAAVPELAWNVDFLSRLVAGRHPIGLTEYMFDASKPVWLRGLSLFHVVLLPLVLWTIFKLGYDRRAWLAQSALAPVVLAATYLLTDPSKNINWVFGPGGQPQHRWPPLVYLLALMLFFPIFLYWPMHQLFARIFRIPH